MKLLISVVVPTYRRRESLRRLLLALGNQTLEPKAYEVVVSIDGSEDGTREMVSALSVPYRLRGIWHQNVGRAAACNRGIECGEADLCVILDDDMEPGQEFLAGHLELHQQAGQKGKDICVLGPVPIRWDRSSPPVVQMMGAVHADHVKKLSQPAYHMQIRDFYTGNTSIRREVMLRVGAFDADFTAYGNEDRELFMRLASAGIPVIYSLKAQAYQHYEKDFAALVRDRASAGRTAVQLVRKHPAAQDAFLMAKYRQTSRRWRYMRWMLLKIGRAWSGTPRVVGESVNMASRIWPAAFQFLAPAALDYIYWDSAFSEMRAARTSSRSPQVEPPTFGGTNRNVIGRRAG